MPETVNGEPSWSPVQSLPQAELTQSGLLVLDVGDGEVEVFRCELVELRSTAENPLPNPGMGGSWVDRNMDLTATLTTHRIVLANGKAKWFLHHSNIYKVSPTGGGISFKSPKIQINTHALGELLLCFRSTNPNKERDEFLKLLQKSLERKAWEAKQRMQQKKKTSDAVAARKVGVDAILTKNALRHKEAARLTSDAFDGDAETLLREATELMSVIQKYVSTLEKSGEAKSDQAETQLNDMMSNMGMTSALSRKAYHGDDFYDTLARQLSDFLRSRLTSVGGVMALTDVYCLFNRARGSNLISPEDLLAASTLLSSLNLGMSLRSFPSGVQVIQLDAFSDAKMAQTLLEKATKDGPLTSLQISRELKIPSLLAQEQLLAAERMGLLCRDVTLENTRFYPNRFKEF